MYRSLSFWGKHGSSLTASARLVSGPMATREICGKHVLVVQHRRADSHYGQFSHLVLVFSHQPDHCTDRMLFLDLLLPLWVFVFDHIPKSIGSKVVTKWVASSNQRTTRTSKDWNLQEKRSAQCSLQQDCSDRHGGRYEIKLRWALLTQFWSINLTYKME